jgi:O-antigen ligase
MHYLKIFYDHPLFGVGLGAGPYALASKLSNHSINLLDPDIHNHYNAMNVTTEILASLGLVGACLFFGFCYLLIQTFRTAYRIPNLEPEEQKNLIAFALSICVLFVTLQFSQSLMRPYIWVHIGLFVGYAQSLQRRSIEKEVELQNKMKIKGLKSTGLLDAR